MGNRSTSLPKVLAAVNEFRKSIQSTVVIRGEDAYSRTREVWNAAVKIQPEAFVFCETVKDVQTCIQIARRHNVPLSIRGRGFNWAGRSLRDKGLVLDLSLMREITVDASTGIATVGVGATASDVLAAAKPHGLVAVTGSVGLVGITGLVTFGGYGPLNSKYGLALDNLLSAEVVLADGTRVNASESSNADLFWALRGGGGSCGVVTSMRLKLHRQEQVASGAIIYSWDQAKKVLLGLGSLMTSASDELTVDIVIMTGPTGELVLLLLPCWTGKYGENESAFLALQTLGTPIMTHLGATTIAAIVAGNDRYVTRGQFHELRNRLLSSLNPEIVQEIVLASETRTSPLSRIILHDFHGAGTRIAPAATAFATRQKHYMMEIISSWLPAEGEDGSAHRRWAELTSARLKPFSLPGGYPSLLEPDDYAQISEFYGNNAERLRRVKKQFDPDGVFDSVISISA